MYSLVCVSLLDRNRIVLLNIWSGSGTVVRGCSAVVGVGGVGSVGVVVVNS